MNRNPQYVYGPVPSRRLGRSLGVDLVPYKVCSYDCCYCQLGRTTDLTTTRKEYVPVAAVLDELHDKLTHNPAIDYISLAGSGEPTLNSELAFLIREIKGMSQVPLAVLTNGSLLWQPDVRDALLEADLVLPSLDCDDEHTFQQVNRPCRDISFSRMVEGLVEFSRAFTGELWLEVLLVRGMTDSDQALAGIARHIQRIAPTRIQLNTVCRPSGSGNAVPVSPRRLLEAQSMLPGRVDIISEFTPRQQPSSILPESINETIMELLQRRPCSARDVAEGLGINPAQALKHLTWLSETGRIMLDSEQETVFYRVRHSEGIGDVAHRAAP